MIICAAAGFYYHFKIIRAMYWEAPLPEDKPLCGTLFRRQTAPRAARYNHTGRLGI